MTPRLHLTDLLEDAIEYLELEVFMRNAERANLDVLHQGAQHRPWTYWIATPGQDDDVVLPLVRREHRLLGVMFGEWRHGPYLRNRRPRHPLRGEGGRHL